jgi:galactoside O-acetyltransferase
MKSSFFSSEELLELNLKHLGKNVLISRFAALYQPEKLSIGDHSRIDDFCLISGDVSIGRNVHIAAYAALYGAYGITLEDFSSVSARVTIYSASDDFVFGAGLTNPTIPDRYRKVSDKGPVLIKKHATVGCHSVILPDSTIAEGASVGALSIVRGELEPWSINAGNPAEKKGRRRNRTILQYEADLLSDEKSHSAYP